MKPKDFTSTAAHNRWFRDHGFEKPKKRRKAFDPPRLELYVPYWEREKYGHDVQLEIDGKLWEVISVRSEPENDRAVVGMWPAGCIEAYNRGE